MLRTPSAAPSRPYLWAVQDRPSAASCGKIHHIQWVFRARPRVRPDLVPDMVMRCDEPLDPVTIVPRYSAVVTA